MTIVVPDAERGFVLAGLLARYGAEVVDGGDAFTVELEAPPEHDLAAVLSVIEAWMRDELVEAARVEIDGRRYTMESAAPARPPGSLDEKPLIDAVWRFRFKERGRIQA